MGRTEKLANLYHIDDSSLDNFENDWRSSGHTDRFQGLGAPPSMSRLGHRGGDRGGDGRGLGYDPRSTSQNRTSRRTAQYPREAEIIDYPPQQTRPNGREPNNMD